MAGCSGIHSLLLKLGMFTWGYQIICPGPRMVFDLTEHSSSRSSSHQLLPPVGSVLVMLASVQLIPVHLIKLPPVTSFFWAVQLSMRHPCSIPVLLQSGAKLPSALGRWEFTSAFNEMLYNYGDTYIQPFVFLILETENCQTGSVLCYVEEALVDDDNWIWNATALSETNG